MPTPNEFLRKSLHAILRKAGVEFPCRERMKPLLSLAGAGRAPMLRHHGIQTVIDVGANTGQFGAELRGWGFHGRIISFEVTGNAASGSRLQRPFDRACGSATETWQWRLSH